LFYYFKTFAYTYMLFLAYSGYVFLAILQKITLLTWMILINYFLCIRHVFLRYVEHDAKTYRDRNGERSPGEATPGTWHASTDKQGLRQLGEHWNSSRYSFVCPRHSKNGGGALSVTPVCVFVSACVRPSVRPSVIKIWCRLNNFKKTAWIQFKFGMLIYNIKTQVKFDLGYNPLIFDGVMGLL